MTDFDVTGAGDSAIINPVTDQAHDWLIENFDLSKATEFSPGYVFGKRTNRVILAAVLAGFSMDPPQQPVLLRPKLRELFQEAHRRYENFGKRDGRSLDEAWIGLGSQTTYKPALDARLMRPLNGDKTPGIAHWFVLTPRGMAVYRNLFPPGAAPLVSQRKGPYDHFELHRRVY